MKNLRQRDFSFKNHLTKIGLVVTLSLNATAGFTANECRVKYQHKNNSGVAYSPKYLNISSGQTKTVNAAHLDYVKNLKNRDVKIWVGNYNKILKKNDLDPFPGFHLADVTFKKVKCLNNNAPMPIDVIIQQMKNTGNSANQIAIHLKNTLNQNASQIVSWLKGVGYSGYNTISKALKAAGYSVNQIVSAMKSAGRFTVNQIAKGLKAAGYSVNQIVKALKSAGKFTANQISKALKAAGYSVNQIVKAMKSAGKFTANQISKALKAAGYSVNQIVKAMNSAGKFTAKQITLALKAVHLTAREIALALNKELKLSAQQVEQILKQIGYSAQQAADAVKRFAKSSGRAAEKAANDTRRAVESFNIVEEFCGFKTNASGKKDVVFYVNNIAPTSTVGVSIAGRNLRDVKVKGLPNGLNVKYSTRAPRFITTKPEWMLGFSIGTVTPEKKYASVSITRNGNRINTTQRSGRAYAVDKYNKRIKGAYCDWTIQVEPMPLVDPNLPERLDAPTFISPNNVEQVYNNASNLKSPALKWNRSANANGYSISLEKHRGSYKRYKTESVASRASRLCHIFTGLSTGSYRWRVRAKYDPAARYNGSKTVYSDYTTYRTFRISQNNEGNVSPVPTCR